MGTGLALPFGLRNLCSLLGNDSRAEAFLAHYFVVRGVIMTPGDNARSRICLWTSLAFHNRAGAPCRPTWLQRKHQRSPQASYEADKAFLTRFACQGHRIKFISLKPQAVPSPPMPLGFYYGVWEKGTARRVGRGRSLLPGGRLREAEGRGWGGGSPREGIFPNFITCDELIHNLGIFSALKIL